MAHMGDVVAALYKDHLERAVLIVAGARSLSSLGRAASERASLEDGASNEPHHGRIGPDAPDGIPDVATELPPPRLFLRSSNTSVRAAAALTWARYFEGGGAAPTTWQPVETVLPQRRRVAAAAGETLRILVDADMDGGRERAEQVVRDMAAKGAPKDAVTLEHFALQKYKNMPAAGARASVAPTAGANDDGRDAAHRRGQKRPAAAASAPQPRHAPPLLRTELYVDSSETTPSVPFAGLQLASFAGLEAADALPRVTCPRCQHKGKHFCKKCFATLLPAPHEMPMVALPIPLMVLKHAGEDNAKSTAVHAQVLAPAGTHLITYPAQCNREALLRTCGVDAATAAAPTDAVLAAVRAESVMLFPSDDAVAFAAMPPAARTAVRRIFVIDGTWTAVRKMVVDLADCLGGPIPAVTLAHPGRTHFWRPNGTGNSAHLATIEAIHLAYREYAAAVGAPPADVAQLDNLLFLFAHQHAFITKTLRQGGTGGPPAHVAPAPDAE